MESKELSLPSGVAVFSKGGLEFTRQPSQEEWMQIGRYVTAARAAGLRWIADWRREGRRQFGDEAVTAAEQSLQLEFKDLRAAEALEALECRSESLTDEHHVAIARALPVHDGLEKAREQWQKTAQEWLELAERESLSPRELQASIRAGKIVRATDAPQVNAGDKSSGMVTIEGVSAQFDLWLKKVEPTGFPDKWDAARLAKVKSLLWQIYETAGKVSSLLLMKGGAPEGEE